MNIQNNTSNTTAFQAKLIVRGSSVNSKRITNIQKIFENNTKKLNGTLYCNTLEKGKNAQDGFSTVTTETNRQYIFKDSLKIMLEKLTDNEIAKKICKSIWMHPKRSSLDKRRKQIIRRNKKTYPF